MSSRTGAIAVLTPFLGLPSETFIRRHVEELAPGRTIAVTTSMQPPSERVWSVNAPVVRLDGRHRLEVSHKARNAWARVRRQPTGRWRWEPSDDDVELLTRRLRAFDVTAVLVEYLDVFLPLLPALRQLGIRVVGHGHGIDVSARLRSDWWSARYRAWELADAVVTVSEHSRRRLVERCGLDPERVQVIPCGVDLLPRPAAPDAARRSTGDGVHVLAVGRMVPKKDPLATVEAFRLARRQVDGLRLTMAGGGPMLSEVRAAVAAAGLDEHVTLLGHVDHERVLELFGEADVFVQHSVTSANGNEEGLPVSVLEAMAHGLPVLSTRHAGIPEAVVEDATGLLVDEHDVDGMARALVVLASDHDRRRSYGAAARARVVERFSWRRERDALLAVLGLVEAGP